MCRKVLILSLKSVLACDSLLLCYLGQHVCILGESKQYVQGVAWDPQGQWVVTHGNDR